MRVDDVTPDGRNFFLTPSPGQRISAKFADDPLPQAGEGKARINFATFTCELRFLLQQQLALFLNPARNGLGD